MFEKYVKYVEEYFRPSVLFSKLNMCRCTHVNSGLLTSESFNSIMMVLEDIDILDNNVLLPRISPTLLQE